LNLRDTDRVRNSDMANRFLENAAKLAPLYDCLLAETKKIFPKFDKDPWHSIGFFLRGYAYEHQGRAPDYAYAAADSIVEACDSEITTNSAEMVWTSFRQKLSHRNLNCARNPLCPRGWRYQHQYRKQSRQASVKKLSVVELAFQELAGKPLAAWAREQLKSGNTQASHSILRTINGVSDKIASLFLRDIATIYEITVADDQKMLLQPVDGWVRFVARELQQNRSLNDMQCAQFIVRNSTASEKTNQGAWYFCTRAAGSSRYVVARSIKDVDYFRKTINLHLDHLVNRAKPLVRIATRS
jgi:hypothetical protein